MDESDESMSIYEVCGVYAVDYATGARIEQFFDITAPTDIGKAGLAQIIADETGRMAHSIEEVNIISEGKREELTLLDAGVYDKSRIQLGGV